MTIHPLPENSHVRDQVLPAVWAGYRSPSIRPPVEMVDFISQLLQQGHHVPKEAADKMSTTFWMDSVHDFCVNYLGRDLTDDDHNHILQTADKFVKQKTIINIDENEKDIIKLLAAKVVLDAHQRANHAMSNACFLVEWDRLPKENIFMLQKGISPIFYEKDEFDRSELLKNKVQGVPEDRILNSFTKWLHHSGMRYMPVFNQMRGLMADMGTMNALILKKAAESYIKEQRKITHLNNRHSYRERHSWRGRV